MTLDELVARLTQLREVAGRGDIDVGRSLPGSEAWDSAACELATVVRIECDHCAALWASPEENKEGTTTIVSIF